MIESEKRQFGEMLRDVMSMYGKDITPGVISIWWEAVKGYELFAVSQALSRHASNPDSGQFAPKPADVVKHLSGTNASAALIAWSKVEKAIRRVGPYSDVVFDDPIIHLVISDMGGWIQLCEASEDELPFKRNEFEKRYQGYKLQGGRSEYPRMLTGLSRARSDEKFKHMLPPPKVIGDREVALQVFQGGGERQLQIGTMPDEVNKVLESLSA